MTEARKAFVHVGLDKTGTTAIQAWCAQNEALIRSTTGLYYPREGRKWGHHIGLANHCGFGLEADAARAKSARDEYRALEGFFSGYDGGDVLLSSEHFSYGFSDESALSLKFMLRAFDEIHVILVLRSPADWLRSKYAEAVKWGATLAFDRFAAENCGGRSSMARALMFFLNSFDRGRAHVLLYDEVKDDVLRHVLSVADRRFADLDTGAVDRANPSIGAADIEALRICNSAMNLGRGLSAYEFFRFYQTVPASEEFLALNGRAYGPNFSPSAVAAIELEIERLVNFLPEKRNVFNQAHAKSLSARRIEFGRPEFDLIEHRAEQTMEEFYRQRARAQAQAQGSMRT